jgi:hypothetical protein
MLSALFAAAMILAPAAAQPIRIVLVGDSTVNDEGGWGTGFRASFGPPIECVNLARNGTQFEKLSRGGLVGAGARGKPRFVYTMTLAQAEQLGPAGSARLAANHRTESSIRRIWGLKGSARSELWRRVNWRGSNPL